MPPGDVHSRECACFSGRKIVSPGLTGVFVSSVHMKPSPESIVMVSAYKWRWCAARVLENG